MRRLVATIALAITMMTAGLSATEVNSDSLLAAAELAADAPEGAVTSTTVTVKDENGNDVQVAVTVTISNGEVTIIPVDNTGAFAGANVTVGGTAGSLSIQSAQISSRSADGTVQSTNVVAVQPTTGQDGGSAPAGALGGGGSSQPSFTININTGQLVAGAAGSEDSTSPSRNPSGGFSIVE